MDGRRDNKCTSKVICSKSSNATEISISIHLFIKISGSMGSSNDANSLDVVGW